MEDVDVSDERVRSEARDGAARTDGHRSTGKKAGGATDWTPRQPKTRAAKQAKQTPASSTSSSSQQDDVLLQQAADELRQVKRELAVRDEDRQKLLHTLIGRIYVLSMDGMRDEARHRRRLERTKVRVRQDTPHHKQTLRAVLAEAGGQPPKGTEHEWAQVITALELEGVAENTTAVAHWLSEDVDVNGVPCRGFSRAEEVVRTSKKLKDDRQAERQERKAEQQEEFSSIIDGSPVFGTIQPADDETCPEGLWVSLNRDGEVLRSVALTERDLRTFVVRHAT